MSKEPTYVNRTEAARQLGVDPSTMTRYLKEGRVVGAKRRPVKDPRSIAKREEGKVKAPRQDWMIPVPVKLLGRSKGHWLSPGEASSILGVTYEGLRWLAGQGKLSVRQEAPGKEKWYSKRSVYKLLEERQKQS